MLKRTILLLAVSLVGGCAHRDPALPDCDGTDRRPANPNGSVLDGTAVTAAPVRTTDETTAPAEGGCA